MMKVKPGFTVFERGSKIAWITPHSGPCMETPTSRDDHSDTVASLCWKKVGGWFIMSTMPRKRIYGIDYNRDPPTLKDALKYYGWFTANENPEKLQQYRMKYSWVARNRRDHFTRRKIYRNFWDTVKKSGRNMVFVHRKFSRLKNFPSIMDVVAYEDHGYNRDMLRTVVSRVNRKFSPFLKSISRNYKNAIILEEQRVVDRVKEIFPDFDMEKIGIEYKTHIEAVSYTHLRAHET